MGKKRSLPLRRRLRIPVIALAFFGLILLCVIIAGFIPFSNKTLKNRIEQLLQESLNGRVTIAKLNITPWTGIVLQDVRYRFNDQQKGTVRLSCTFPRIAVTYYLIPLVFKQVIVKNISLEKPEIGVDIPAPYSRKGTLGEAFSLETLSRVIATMPYTVLVRNISIIDAHAAVIRDGSVFFDGKGITFSLTIGLKRDLTVNGRVTIADMTLPGNFRTTKCKASLRMKTTDVFLDEYQSTLYGGMLSIKGSANISKGVMHSLSVSMNKVKLNEWYRTIRTAPGNLIGNMDVLMNFDKSDFVVDSLKGKGWIKATDVSAQGTSLQKNLVLLLVIPKLVNMKFNTIYADLVFKKGKIHTKHFYGKGDPLDFTADGWVDVNGRFSERIDGIFSADFSKSLPDFIKNSLLPVEGDAEKRSFNCTAWGTAESPRLKVDQRIVNRAVGNVFDAIGKSLGNLFKKK